MYIEKLAVQLSIPGSLTEVGARLAASEPRYPPVPIVSPKVLGLTGRGITMPGFLCG